jgi:YVTN family beta-propeller protein
VNAFPHFPWAWVQIQSFVSPDGQYLLVANQGTEENPGTTVSVIDTDTFDFVRSGETGAGAHGVTIDPTSRHANITNTFDNTVSVLDLKEMTVVATVSVGSMPNGITFTSQAVGIAPTVELDLKMDANDASGMKH